MLKVKIAGKSYKAPAHWEDITLSQCAWLSDKINEQSEEIIEYFKSFMGEEVKMPKDIDALEAFIIDSVGYLLNIPLELRLQVRRADIKTLGMAMLPRFVLGVMGYSDYKSENLASFKHNGATYIMPSTGADISGEPTPLSEITALEGCQLSDLTSSGVMALAPLAVAIVCRREGEKYDEELIKQRSEEFKDLPASIYWELHIMVVKAHEYLRASFKDCYGKKSSTGKKAVWTDTIVSMAEGKPSELFLLRELPFYDFMHMLSEQIKEKKEKWKIQAAASGLKLK